MKVKIDSNRNLDVVAENQIESDELEVWFSAYLDNKTKLNLRTFKITAYIET